MPHTGQEKRRRYFIDKGFQSKFVALLLVFIVSLGMAGIIILWLGDGGAVTDQDQADFDGAVIAMLMVVLLFVVFTVWYGVRFSHRIVGPIYAFNRHLTWVRDGNYTRDLSLREKDEFQNLAQTFNTMQSTLRQRTREDIETYSRIDDSLTELADALGADPFDAEHARDLIKNLQQVIEGVKVKDEGFITP